MQAEANPWYKPPSQGKYKMPWQLAAIQAAANFTAIGHDPEVATGVMHLMTGLVHPDAMHRPSAESVCQIGGLRHIASKPLPKCPVTLSFEQCLD